MPATRVGSTTQHSRRWWRILPLYLALTLAGFLVALPFIWMVLTSFKTRVDAFAIPPKIVFSPTLSNYRLAFVDGDFGQNLERNFRRIAPSRTALAPENAQDPAAEQHHADHGD